MAPQYASKSKQKARPLPNDIDAWKKWQKWKKNLRVNVQELAFREVRRFSFKVLVLAEKLSAFIQSFFLNAGIDSTRNPLRIGITQRTEYTRESGLKKPNHTQY